jgi:hypothetical protein
LPAQTATATTRLRAGDVAADARSARAAPAGLTNHTVQAVAAHSCDLKPRQRYPEALAVAETILSQNGTTGSDSQLVGYAA